MRVEVSVFIWSRLSVGVSVCRGVYAHMHRHYKKNLSSLFLLLSFTGEVFDYLVAHGRMKEKEARAKFREVKLKFLSNIENDRSTYQDVKIDCLVPQMWSHFMNMLKMIPESEHHIS